MTPRINNFTFDRLTDNPTLTLEPGDRALVLVVALRDRREEYLWLRVVERYPNGVYEAVTLDASQHFAELPAGDTVYFDGGQVLRAQLQSGEVVDYSVPVLNS